MIHSQAGFKPNIHPVFGTEDKFEIDRAQGIDPTATLNRLKVEELGRDGLVGHLKRSATVSYRLSQLEYGNIELYRQLANKVSSTLSLSLSDFKTSAFDIMAYLTDDDGTFKGTLWYPELRLSGFSLNVGSPDAVVERSFDFAGEKHIFWQGNNKYLVTQKHTVTAANEAAGQFDVTLDTTAIEDPDNTGVYVLRVVHVSGSTSTELTVSTDYTDTASTLTIKTGVGAVENDVIKLVYTCTTLPSGYSTFTENDSDVVGILADSVSLYLGTANYLYRMQSATIDVRLDREDQKEIGNTDVVQRGVKNNTVTVTLGRLLDQFTIDEVLRGEVVGYGKIDIDKLSTNITFIMKVYEDSTKATFKWGIKAATLAASELRGTAAIDSYCTGGNTLEGESLLLSTTEGDLV